MTKIIHFIQHHWFSFTLLLLTAITTLSLWPADQLPNVPGTDKTHHFIAYAALIFPTALRKPQNYRMLVLIFITFSGMIELIQPYVNRYGEWLDMLANTLGLVCGWLLAKILLSWSKKAA
jgi:VanZ family protein